MLIVDCRRMNGNDETHLGARLRPYLSIPRSLSEGGWEMAVYLPEQGSRMPRMAIALDFHHRSAAMTAMDSFIEQLERTWPSGSGFRLLVQLQTGPRS